LKPVSATSGADQKSTGTTSPQASTDTTMPQPPPELLTPGPAKTTTVNTQYPAATNADAPAVVPPHN
jgi:hypothetical protein